MRNTTILGLSAAIVFVLAASYGLDVRITEMPKEAVPGATPAIDSMQMMREAKDLPEQQYDAN